MSKKRIGALVDLLRKNKIGALLVTKPENIFYLTGFTSTRIMLAVNAKKSFAVTDFIYAEAASKTLKRHGIDVYIADCKSSPEKIISSTLNKYRVKGLGIESHSMNLDHFQKLKGSLKKTHLVLTAGIVESLREIKDAGEIRSLKKAIGVTADTFKSVKMMLRPKTTEAELARSIKVIFIKNGADGSSFEPIVAGQPAASQPHYIPSLSKLGNNNAILLDIGCKLSGYNSDLTRMCSLGKITPKFVKLYAVLLEAQRRAIEHVKPGVKICDIDHEARQYIESKGLGRFFGHNTGHGIGLEIHEHPSVSSTNVNTLKEGMVFTVEPGIYIPGYGGLRIEDVIMVTRNGRKVLTHDIDKSI
ncbi:MAG: aminopeptidase P family protein [Candidatus Omnitrophica bacterium]|nr:aminopeptidase P family protein [Candidatus Omnitrophota bacterium]